MFQFPIWNAPGYITEHLDIPTTIAGHITKQPRSRYLKRPLKDAKIAIVTTSFPVGDWSNNNPPRREVWSRNVTEAPANLYNQNLAWDKDTTHTRDRETYLPLLAMQSLAAKGVIGGLTERFRCVPTDYSHRNTIEHDAPNILNRLIKDGADAALLIPL
mgnify:FL=1